MSLASIKRNAHNALAAGMALWLSGVVFLFCCGEMTAASMSAESCPLAKISAHCDKEKNADGSESVTKQRNQNTVDCCAFMAAFFDRTRTVEIHKQLLAAAPSLGLESPRPIAGPANFAPATWYRSVTLPKNDTFLKNLAFRI